MARCRRRRPRSWSKPPAPASAPAGSRTSPGLERRHCAHGPPSGTPPSARAATETFVTEVGANLSLGRVCVNVVFFHAPHPDPPPQARGRGTRASPTLPLRGREESHLGDWAVVHR